MENGDRRMLLAGLGLVGVAAASAASAGSLNPPAGPVAPTGKTTTEIEPRVAVQSLTGDAANGYVISQPGSYYFTGNINGTGGKHGISIQADGVTVDLCGFALIGEAAGSGIGINVPAARTSLCIHNGTIRNWRSHGVAALNASSSALERLRAFGNLGDGLQIGNESVVRDCIMTGNTIRGLSSADRVLVTGCVADVNGGSGLFLGSDVLVLDCLVSRGGTSGITVSSRSTVARCTVTRNTGQGIVCELESTVADCSASLNFDGIALMDRCVILRNACEANTSTGIVVGGSGSRIDGNTCTNNGIYGIYLALPNNLVVRNSASGNPTQFFSAGGAISFAAVSNVSASANFLSDQPWTNFIY
jgi:parallel beta-helix repeat protein